MKPLLILLLLVFTLNIALSQTTYKSGFREGIGSPPNRHVIAADGSSIFSAVVREPDFKNRVFISKIKNDGAIAWANVYGTKDNGVAIDDMIATKDNGFVVCLESYDSTRKIILVKGDSLGRKIWQQQVRTLSLADREHPTGMLSAAKDGGFYYLQQNATFYSDFKGPHCILFKFNNHGKLVWKSQFEVKAVSDYGTTVTNISETADGGVMLSLTTVSCEAYCEKFYFLTFTPDGKTKWRYDFQESFVGAVALTGSDNNNLFILLTGHHYDSPRDLYGFLAISLNKETGRAKTYALPSDLFSLQAFLQSHRIDDVKRKSLIRLGGNNSQAYSHYNIYAFDDNWNLHNASYIERTNTTGNIFLEKHDPLGRLCPNYQLPVIDSVVVQPITFYQSNFSLANKENITIEKSSELTVERVNGYSIICAGTAPKANTVINNTPLITSTNISLTGITITPNPAHAQLAVQGLPADDGNTLAIVDLQGRVMQKTVVRGTSSILNISSLANGVYLLTVQNKKGQAALKFVKE